MSPTKPTILIIPGSFSVYGAYDPFLALLRAQDFTALAICLPSTQKRYPLPPATLQDDAAHVRGVVERLIAENDGTEVVILAHSYGGAVAAEALDGLGVKEGKKGGVKRAVFLAATVPRVGETQLKAMRAEEGGGNPLFAAVDGYMHGDAVVMAPFICNDLPYAEAYEHSLKLPHHSAISFQSPVTKASFKDFPNTYVFCERDMIVPPESQERFIENIREGGGECEVRKIDSGHCPNFSRPQELLGLLVEVALA